MWKSECGSWILSNRRRSRCWWHALLVLFLALGTENIGVTQRQGKRSFVFGKTLLISVNEEFLAGETAKEDEEEADDEAGDDD